MKKNNRIVLIDTSYPINSRNSRIIDSLNDIVGAENIKVISWARNDDREIKPASNESIYIHPSPLGDRFAKLRSLNGYRRYVNEQIKAFNPKVIIASHWDSLLMASTLKKPGQILIYENLDMPSGRYAIRKILSVLEHHALRKCDAISYASHFYRPFYDFFKGTHIILENKLSKEALCKHLNEKVLNGPLRIMFNGAIRYPETMLNLFEAAGNLQDVEIILWGYPSGKDGEIILKKAGEYNNIKYLGSYNYKQIPDLYKQADVVWGVYPADDFNVKYAISNKYHESIAYGVPGIYADETMLGEMVDESGLGFTVNAYSVKDIKKLLYTLSKNKMEIISRAKENLENLRNNISIDWQSEFEPFKDYILTVCED